MRKVFLNIFFLILVFYSKILPQQFSVGSPEWLVDKFFSAENFSEKAKYYTGEMLNDINNPSIGEELKGRGTLDFHKIKDTSDECVFSVKVSVDNKVIDFYYFLVKRAEGWKNSAVRRFLLPEFIYVVLDSLSNLDSLSSADSTFFTSLKLFTSNDNELKNYLNAHLSELQGLVDYFNKNQSNGITKELNSLGCNAIFKDRNYPGCIFIQILAFETKEIGFIFADESTKLPEVSPKKFICVDEAITGWFIYRMI